METSVSGRRASISIAIGILIAVSGCGADRPGDATTASVPNAATSTVEPPITPDIVPSTIAQTTVPPPSSPPTSAPADVIEMDTVQFSLPAGAVVDERPIGVMPPFVVGYGRWLVPQELVLIVAQQNIEPSYSQEDVLTAFESNGLAWRLFDAGPRDGTVVTAVAEAGDVWILVTAQGWTPESRTQPIEAAEQVARSVRMMESQDA